MKDKVTESKIEYVICTKGAHAVLRASLVTSKYVNCYCCRECFNTNQREIAQKRRDLKKANRPEVKIPKTRVCVNCEKRKKITEFYKKKPPRIPVFKPDYSRECKKCHYEKCRASLIKRTTKKERSVYIRDYMRTRNSVLPSQYHRHTT